MNRAELENLANTATSEDVKKLAQAELQKLDLMSKASQGDKLSESLLVLKEAIDSFNKNKGSSGGVSKEELKKLLSEIGTKGKVKFSDLDPELQSKLTSVSKVQLTLNTPYAVTTGTQLQEQMVNSDLFQKMLSDFKAQNNVYLYGAAGTGKTFIISKIAEFLGYEYIEVNCNQFTSPLELIGGQTIDGYQEGKLEMAWTNVMKDGSQVKGVVLALDELPKLDPNTAGLLNSALAKMKEGTPDKPVFIYNGKGEKIFKKNIFVVATGNTKLNETSTEYEANFKQDLSLQDRFVGSTYEVLPNYKSEYEGALKGFAFLFNYLMKVREVIIERKWTGVAFVSFRILISLRDTYLVERNPNNQNISSDYAISNVKTLKQGLDSFLNLFSKSQQETIKTESKYDEFINEVLPSKLNRSLDSLDTDAEKKKTQSLIEKNQRELDKVNS